MKNKILTVIKVIVGIIILLLFRNIYSDHNLKKTISACIVAQIQTGESPDVEKAKKVCEERVKK